MMLQFFSLIRSPQNPQKRNAGFTLTELIVVVVIAGVLAAIAAPGWLTFTNRQRVNSANKELLQTLREAQAEAIAKRTTYGVSLANTPDGPSVTKFVERGQGSLAAGVTDISTEVLGNETEATGLSLSTVPNNPSNQYRFNFDGSINSDALPAVPVGSDYVFKIEVSKDGTRRCVIAETLLGALREGSDGDCDA